MCLSLLASLKLLTCQRWWQLEGDARKDISEAHKLAGFAFFVIGAASGIGKSTFARSAFQELYDLITSADSEK